MHVVVHTFTQVASKSLQETPLAQISVEALLVLLLSREELLFTVLSTLDLYQSVHCFPTAQFLMRNFRTQKFRHPLCLPIFKFSLCTIYW